MISSELEQSLIAGGLLAARWLLASLFLVEGVGKIGIYTAAGAYMQKFGVPAALLPLVIATEICAAGALILGWQSRYAALALAGFSLLAALIFHHDFGDRNQLLHFQKDLAIGGGFLALCVAGAGAWSLDARSQR